MGFDKDFSPVLRFAVMSDIHYNGVDSPERERFRTAVNTAYSLAEGCEYNRLDAIYIVGDFTGRGTLEQMQLFKQDADSVLREGTQFVVSLASHEYMDAGEQTALERFKDIFDMPIDTHKVINGFHFISLTSTRGCHFDDAKISFAARELEAAREDSREKPIFFFQHPHISGTVYGSANWGEDELTPTLMNYPEIIDFSGHSHAPVNDPRSIHQLHFTCHGTGTLSYFELDEFDKHYGTIPPDDHTAAQMLIVEADKDNRVRIYPYDIITGNFFPCVRRIDRPWDTSSFTYTDKRYATDLAPIFEDGTFISGECSGSTLKVSFAQAKVQEDYVNDYVVTVRDADGYTVRRKALWSGYYFYNMPQRLSVEFDNLKAGKYTVSVSAGSFWNTRSAKDLTCTAVIE